MLANGANAQNNGVPNSFQTSVAHQLYFIGFLLGLVPCCNFSLQVPHLQTVENMLSIVMKEFECRLESHNKQIGTSLQDKRVHDTCRTEDIEEVVDFCRKTIYETCSSRQSPP